MPATANFTQNNVELFRLRTAILICLLVLIAPAMSIAQTTSPQTNSAAPSDARKSFEVMKSLIGTWQGTVMGIPIDVTIRLASSGTAILHEATADGKRPPDHEITMFYVDGDRLLGTHYCDGGNRPRWEGKVSPDGKTIEFTFLDITGGTQRGYVKRTAFTIIDASKHVVELTFIQPDGKVIEARGEFQRTK